MTELTEPVEETGNPSASLDTADFEDTTATEEQETTVVVTDEEAIVDGEAEISTNQNQGSVAPGLQYWS